MQVFISHAVADVELAGQLSRELENAGFNVWSPERAILPGDNWAMETGKALENSDVMVALFSRRANPSPTLRQEVQYALTSGNYRGRVVPVFVDFVTLEPGLDVPWVLFRFEPIYLQSSSPDFAQVVARVQAVAKSGSHAPA
ncbi:MAG: toll/interleukin-1 receptor domain-containing protein [Thermoguttaceae bacterium]